MPDLDALEHEQKPRLDRLSLSESTLRTTLEFVKMADRKARFLIQIALALFGASFIGLPPSIGVLRDYLEQGGGAGLAVFFVVMGLYGVCVTCLIVAVVKMVGVVRPRILAGDGRGSLFFFQSIARMSLKQFRDAVAALEPDRAADEVAMQVYHNAIVAAQKYGKLNEAINWMLAGGVSGVLFAMVLITASELL